MALSALAFISLRKCPRGSVLWWGSLGSLVLSVLSLVFLREEGNLRYVPLDRWGIEGARVCFPAAAAKQIWTCLWDPEVVQAEAVTPLASGLPGTDTPMVTQDTGDSGCL